MHIDATFAQSEDCMDKINQDDVKQLVQERDTALRQVTHLARFAEAIRTLASAAAVTSKEVYGEVPRNPLDDNSYVFRKNLMEQFWTDHVRTKGLEFKKRSQELAAHLCARFPCEFPNALGALEYITAYVENRENEQKD